MSRRFFRDAGFLAGVEVVSRLKGLVLLPVLTHHFGAIGYGAWTQVSVVVAVLLPVLFLGTDSAVLRFLPGSSPEERRAAYSAWVGSVVPPTIVVALALAVFAGVVAPIFFGSADRYAPYVALAGVALLSAVLVMMTRTWFRIGNEARYVGAVTLLQTVTSLTAAIVVVLLHKGPFSLVSYSVVGDFLIAGWLGLVIMRRAGWGRPRWMVMRRLLRFGLPLFPSAYALLGLNAMDRLFLVRYDTLRTVGVYALGYSLGYLGVQLLVNPVWVMFPGAVAEMHNMGDTAGVVRLFRQSVSAALLLTVPAIFGTAVLGDLLVRALAPPSFSDAATVVPIVMSGYLFHMLASYCEVRLYLIQRQAVSTVSMLFAVALNLVLNVVLIPRYSILGAAIATGVAFGAQLLITWAIASRAGVVETPVRVVRDVLAASVGMTVVLLGLQSVLPLGSVRLALPVLVAAGLIVYLVLLIALGRQHLTALTTLIPQRWAARWTARPAGPT